MEEIDLRELFNIFWNKKYQILVTVLIFIVVGIVYTIGFKTPMYTSSTTLLLAMSSVKEGDTTNTITTTDITLNSKLVSTYSELIKSRNVLGDVIKNLGIDESEDALKSKVSVTSVEDTEVIRISVTHENAAYSTKIANEIAEVFKKKIVEFYNINNINTVDKAVIPENPSNINHTKDVILFAFVGLAISAAYVFIVNMLDNTIKTSEDIEKAYGIPVLVSVPQIESFESEKGGKK